MTLRRTVFNQNVGTGCWILTIILFIIVFTTQYSAAAGPLKIYAVNYPLKYFAERIGGDQVRAALPAPAASLFCTEKTAIKIIAAYNHRKKPVFCFIRRFIGATHHLLN